MWIFHRKEKEPVPSETFLLEASEDNPLEKRSFQLLWKFLTPEQRKGLEQTKYFDLVGFSGATYQITKFGEIAFRDIKPASICVAPRATMPRGDKILQFVIALQTEEGEKAFLNAATVTTVHGTGRIVDPVKKLFQTIYPYRSGITQLES